VIAVVGVAVRDVTDLIAYRRSFEFANDAHGHAASWGSGRADRRRMVFLARGSACEVEHWIHVAQARGLPLPPEAEERAAELSKLINGLLRAWS